MRSIQVRLHPKPQLEVQYRVSDALKLLQMNRVVIDVLNRGSHTHSRVSYPCEAARSILHAHGPNCLFRRCDLQLREWIHRGVAVACWRVAIESPIVTNLLFGVVGAPNPWESDVAHNHLRGREGATHSHCIPGTDRGRCSNVIVHCFL